MKSRVKQVAVVAAVSIGLVGGFEGLRTAAYRDPVGIPTICFGETKGVRLGQTRTPAECNALLRASLIEHEQGMRDCLRNPDRVPEPTYIAFLSFAYNVGARKFCASTLVRKANAGDLRGACNELLKWDKARGVKLPGLSRRRQEERTLCLGGVAA